MKNRLKEFLQNKRDLVVFLSLIVVTFITVLAIANMTFEDDDFVANTPDVEDNNDSNVDSDNDTNITPDETPEEIVYYITAPYSGDKTIVRSFYNFYAPGTNANSIIVSADGAYVTSQGVGFANEDNSSFDVMPIYSGVVTSVVEDDVIGTTITIEHGDNLISTYYSLTDVTVSVGDKVEEKTVIAISAETSFDLNSGVHVHVEVYSKDTNEYIDLTTIIGKTMDDVVASIK